jgi:hypothetical protein
MWNYTSHFYTSHSCVRCFYTSHMNARTPTWYAGGHAFRLSDDVAIVIQCKLPLKESCGRHMADAKEEATCRDLTQLMGHMAAHNKLICGGVRTTWGKERKERWKGWQQKSETGETGEQLERYSLLSGHIKTTTVLYSCHTHTHLFCVYHHLANKLKLAALSKVWPCANASHIPIPIHSIPPLPHPHTHTHSGIPLHPPWPPTPLCSTGN